MPIDCCVALLIMVYDLVLKHTDNIGKGNEKVQNKTSYENTEIYG